MADCNGVLPLMEQAHECNVDVVMPAAKSELLFTCKIFGTAQLFNTVEGPFKIEKQKPPSPSPCSSWR
jgi:hypothetical protein